MIILLQGLPTGIWLDNNRVTVITGYNTGALVVWIDIFLFKRHPELKEVPPDCVSALRVAHTKSNDSPAVALPANKEPFHYHPRLTS